MKLALQGAGVSTGHVRNMKGIATGLAMITVSENDNTIVVVPGANGRVDRACVDSINKERHGRTPARDSPGDSMQGANCGRS